MKKLWISALVAVGVVFGAYRALHAQDAPTVGTSWEYLHLLIPLDRKLETYQRSDDRLLKPLQDAGAEGWELVSANEPTNGLLVGGRASVEFFLKRPRR